MIDLNKYLKMPDDTSIHMITMNNKKLTERYHDRIVTLFTKLHSGLAVVETVPITILEETNE